METNFLNAGGRLWIYAGVPDASVHNSAGTYANIGEYFLNSLTNVLYFCIDGGVSQVWTQLMYLSQMQTMMPKRAFSNPVRTLNTAYQISATRDCQASYSIDITTSLSLLAGTSGTVFFETAENVAFTTNVKTIASFTNANTGALAVGLNLNQTETADMTRIVEAGLYVRLRTANNLGTPTFTFKNSQEVLL